MGMIVPSKENFYLTFHQLAKMIRNTGGLDLLEATHSDVIAVNIACVNICANMNIKRWR